MSRERGEDSAGNLEPRLHRYNRGVCFTEHRDNYNGAKRMRAFNKSGLTTTLRNNFKANKVIQGVPVDLGKINRQQNNSYGKKGRNELIGADLC